MLALSILWAILTAAVIVLAGARKLAARNDDELLHLADADTPAISQQVAVAQKLDKIDHWGKTLTVVVVIYGLALLAAWLYSGWAESAAPLK